MSENPTQKTIRAVALILFIIVLPLGSYFYLYQGRNFYRENLELLKPKGDLAPFSYHTLSGDTLNAEDITGKVWVASILNAPCQAACQQKIEQLKILQGAFQAKEQVKLISMCASETALINEECNIEGINNKFWYQLNGTDSLSKAWKEALFAAYPKGMDQNMFVLVDDSLRIRNYYPALVPDSLELLVRHLAMIMPKDKKKEIGFEREKEK